MATIYYRQWHVSGPAHTREEAADLFHEFHHDPPASVASRAFDDLYDEVAETDTDDLEQIFREWNRGSGRKSDQFRDLRYCERCATYIEGGGEAVTHAAQNHGYDPFQDVSEPEYIRGIRSLSVGDIVEQADEYYVCVPIGWTEIEVR